MQINSVSQFSNYKNFKGSSDNNKYMKLLEKRAYIDDKVEIWENLSTLTLIGAILTGILSIDLAKKLKPKEN